jgi:hypothetical protein
MAITMVVVMAFHIPAARGPVSVKTLRYDLRPTD